MLDVHLRNPYHLIFSNRKLVKMSSNEIKEGSDMPWRAGKTFDVLRRKYKTLHLKTENKHEAVY